MTDASGRVPTTKAPADVPPICAPPSSGTRLALAAAPAARHSPMQTAQTPRRPIQSCALIQIAQGIAARQRPQDTGDSSLLADRCCQKVVPARAATLPSRHYQRPVVRLTVLVIVRLSVYVIARSPSARPTPRKRRELSWLCDSVSNPVR